MTSEIKAPSMPEGLRNICKNYSPKYPNLTKASKGSMNYYPADLLMEVIALIVPLQMIDDKAPTLKELKAIEMWILSVSQKWNIDNSRGEALDRSKGRENS